MNIAASTSGHRSWIPPVSIERRNRTLTVLTLIELDPREVVDGIPVEAGFLTADILSAGPMRETCPHCSGVALELILRRRQVKRSHLLCPHCTRCYDALYENGMTALVLG
ncbi:hypothetical protein [Herbaspirillum autotrophicum]|uniref:hypothetical protein n=1 Tax=Herbaspirillum autotrophicum TaxID=180195 RepID=UPI00067C617E|nr:hypothetical protein [Herbaspirillum autotrophicum]